MNQQDKEKFTALLQSALPPVGGSTPPRDLWPAMRSRLHRPPARLAWFDLALAAFAAAGFIAFPAVIPWVLFQF